MSANLSWRPPGTRHPLPDALKYVLRKGVYSNDTEITQADRTYFQALADAEIDGAQQILDALEKHDTIHLCYEY